MSGFTSEDLCTQIANPHLWKGFDCLQLGQITPPDIQRDGTLITTLVRGAGARPYRVYVRLAPDEDGAPLIKGQCTCRNAPNCEHVAAALMHVLSAESDLLGEVPEMLSFEHWREWMSKAAVAQDSHAAEPTPALLYVLCPGADPVVPWPGVVTMRVWRKASGQYHAPRSINPARTLAADFAAALSSEDHSILDDLSTQEPVENGDGQLLKGRSGAVLLEAMIETGRCRLNSHESPPLRRARGRQRGTCAWELDHAGYQRIAWSTERDGQIVLPVTPPWYVDVEKHTSGPLDTGLPDTVVKELIYLPPVALNEIAEMTKRLDARYAQHELPPPRQINSVSLRSGDPLPVLTLGPTLGKVDNEDRPDPAAASTAILSFDYGGVRVGERDGTVLEHEGQLFHVARRQLLERRHRHHLLRLGLEAVNHRAHSDVSRAQRKTIYGLQDSDAWVKLVTEAIPELEAAGWHIEFADDFHYRPLQVQQWNVDVQRLGIDGLSLDLSVQAGGTTVHLLPAIVAVLRELPREDARGGLDAFPDHKPICFAREQGGLVTIPLGQIRAIVAVLLELYEDGALDEHGRLPLHRLHATRLPELEAALTDAQITRIGLKEPHLLGERLHAVSGIAQIAPPRGLQATLRTYQQRGLDWLQFLRENRLGGVLADDMGLGKTIQTLAHLLLEKQSGRMDRPSLVIAPTSLMVNWRREATHFAPELRVLTLHGPRRGETFEAIPDHDLVLTTYPLLRRDEQALLAHEYHIVVLDEAQAIKNPKTKARQVVAQLSSRQRLCLTGTPMENHLGELWSLFDFALPGYLGNPLRFRHLFRTPIERDGDADRQTLLGRRIAPFMLRRTKEAVVQELPPKTEILRTVELTGDQRELYESIRLSVEERVRKEIAQKGLARSQIMILDALLKLRQVCCDPRLVKLDSAAQIEQSAKFELLMDLLPEMVEEGRRVLLFSQFTSMLKLIADKLKSGGLDYVQLTGRTRDRKTPVDRFQNGEAPIFLISLKAGGVGLNLTAADTVIHYDPWWNPAAETQATDRAHRIGQDKPVFVYKLITEGSVEERIQELQERKRALVEGILGDRANAEPQWSAEDIEMLLRPLD